MPTERLYYRDPGLRRFRAHVVAVHESKGRSGVILDRTAFYPTSGGQPFDTGLLADHEVLEVIDAEGEVVHMLDGAAPDVGSEVEGLIDWPRRFDHMQQHSGQHVLSQAFERANDLRTVSFHLGTDYCTIDLNTPSLDQSAVERAEMLATDVVFDDRPVLIHFVDASDVGQLGLRKATERIGEVRIVEITDFDRSACGGTHVGRTGQIGPIKVRRWERRGETTRVEFVCGWRALRDYQVKHALAHDLAERLSTSTDEAGPAAQRALGELAQARDTVHRLRQDLLGYEAEALRREASPLPLTNGRSAHVVFRVLDGRTPDDLKRLALAIVRADRYVALLGTMGERCHVVFAQTPGLPYDLSRILRSTISQIGGRGGGTRDLAQGGGPAGAAVEAVLEAAFAEIRRS